MVLIVQKFINIKKIKMEKTFKNFRNAKLFKITKGEYPHGYLHGLTITFLLEMINSIENDCYIIKQSNTNILVGIDLGNGFLLGVRRLHNKGHYIFELGFDKLNLFDNVKPISPRIMIKFNLKRFNATLKHFERVFNDIPKEGFNFILEAYKTLKNDGFSIIGSYGVKVNYLGKYTKEIKLIWCDDNVVGYEFVEAVESIDFVNPKTFDILCKAEIPTLNEVIEGDKDFGKRLAYIIFTSLKFSYTIETEAKLVFSYDYHDNEYKINGKLMILDSICTLYNADFYFSFGKAFNSYANKRNELIISNFEIDFLSN